MFYYIIIHVKLKNDLDHTLLERAKIYHFDCIEIVLLFKEYIENARKWTIIYLNNKQSIINITLIWFFYMIRSKNFCIA